MPKRAGNPYSIFNSEYTSGLKKSDPELKMPNAFKLAGDKWATMTDTERKPYNKLAEAERALYEKRMEQRAKLGYFKFEDGSKSTDANNKKRV